MKSGFAVVVGRPSSGKSTLVNTLCGHKVSIVSSVPQTTRRTVRGIVNRDAGQIVFLDTPGYHLSEKEFNRNLNEMVSAALREEPDTVLYTVDLTREPGEEEAALAGLLSREGICPVIAFNKADAVEGSEESAVEKYTRFFGRFWDRVSGTAVSALKNSGTEQLLGLLFAGLEEGESLYPVDYYTDQTPEFRIAEIIREKAMNRLGDELPHSIYVEVADLECSSDNDLWIRAFICVERDSQKGIVIGKNGEKLGSIRKAAKRELKSVFPQNISLDLRVKVNRNWRKNSYQIKSVLDLN